MIQYEDINFKNITCIEELWEMNRQYHEWTSEYFGSLYKGLDFQERMAAFATIDASQIKITVAKDEVKVIGYCLSLIEEKIGEIASMHVMRDQRGKGIGRQLLEDHVAWLKSKDCEDVKLHVSQENDATIGFYKSLGFRPNSIEMRYKE